MQLSKLSESLNVTQSKVPCIAFISFTAIVATCSFFSQLCILLSYSSAEQYIVQYCFLIPSNFMNAVIPQSTDIIKYSSLNVFQFVLCKNMTCIVK